MSEKQTTTTATKIPIDNKLTLFLIGGVIGVVIFGIILILVMIFHKPSLPVSTEEYIELSESEKLERNKDLSQEIYNSATGTETDDADGNAGTPTLDEAAAMENFDQAISSAQTSVDANLARVAAMRYLNLKGSYDQVIELGNQVNNGNGACNYPELDLDSLIVCNNLMETAYYQKGDTETSKKFNEALLKLIEERLKLGNVEE